MKGVTTVKKQIFFLMLILVLLAGWTFACADPDLTLQDTSLRSGAWAEAYAQILAERSGDIQAYQDYVTDITSSPLCRAVGITDLTGDGVPELMFLDLVQENEYGFQVGRFWVYTSDTQGVRCALTLRPEIDDLLYSRYYLAENGLLTIHFSDCEKGWIMQFRPALNGSFTAETTLIEEADFSGEGPDYYFQNGKKITAKKFKSITSQIKAGEGSMIGSLDVDNGGYGFTCTLSEALEALSSGAITGVQPASPSGGRFPELTFFRGTFTAGQKFAVYSAPSARSWRGANGKAAITSGSEIFVAGTEDGWILIMYELESGVIRAGYIDSRKIDGQFTSGDALSFSGTQMTLVAAAEMTDDPVRKNATIGKLKKGTKVTCLAEYRGMIYVEAKVSGKTARGFISPSSLGLGD